MANEIISYLDMCQREGMSLQRGMNFTTKQGYSIILMSVRANAPYADRWDEEGTTLIYEGHNERSTRGGPDPSLIDQPMYTPSGSLTENGKFYVAAQEFKLRHQLPERVQVYEKIRDGIWSNNGIFALVDAWQASDGKRLVFKFKLTLMRESGLGDMPDSGRVPEEATRVIPSAVKLEVWKRDNGRCVKCGATDELHFDHIIPSSKGGTSLKAENIQLLCARHNLSKRDRIE